MNYLTLWARSENTHGTLTAVFTDAEGNELTAPLSAATVNGWKQLTAPVPEGAVQFTGLHFEKSSSGLSHSALLLDQIVLTAHHAVTNSDCPAVHLNSTAVTVDAGAKATISGTATMENGNYPVRAANITVKVDGKTESGAAAMNGSGLTVTTGALAAGTHTVTIDVSDDAGSRTRVSATVTAGSAANAFADTASPLGARLRLAAEHARHHEGAKARAAACTFTPDRNLTRKEFAVTMARTLGLDTSSADVSAFADSDSIPSWAAGAVNAVAKAGFMTGESRGGVMYFNPDADITRAEVMTVIGRLLPRGYAAASLNYRDASAIPSWAAEHVKTCVSAGIIGGYTDGTLLPLGRITRGEIAKVLALL